MEEKVEMIRKPTDMLDEIESYLREIWPDDKPAATRDDEEFWLYNQLSAAMVHISDLRCDLNCILGEL